MSETKVIQAALSEEEFAKLEKMLDEGNEAELQAHLERLVHLDALRDTAREMRERLYRDVILNVHHYLHRKDVGRAMNLLCVAAVLCDDDVEALPPPEVMLAFTKALNAANLERVKFDCEGSA